MRNILIPTDFSENAMNAVKYALELFKYEQCNFYYLHAYEDEVYEDEDLLKKETFDVVLKSVSENSQNNLDELIKSIKELFPNPKHQHYSISSYNTLINEADIVSDAKDIDLIVMGTKGKTNNINMTFGSNTLKVLKYVQCPVLAIPANYSYIQPKHIAFPTNYLIPYKRRELKLLCELAAPYRAIIDMLYISKIGKLSLRQEDNRLFIEEELNKNKLNFKTVDDKDVLNAVHNYIKENNVDMLVMVNTRHSYLENILFQSTVDKLSLSLDIPFLAMQNIKR